MVLLVVLLPILTECKQENIPGQGPSNSRESNFSDEGTVAMTSEEGVISVPPQSPTPAARTVSFLTDHQLELGIRALQAAWFINQVLNWNDVKQTVCNRSQLPMVTSDRINW